jgi:hypothetical protein
MMVIYGTELTDGRVIDARHKFAKKAILTNSAGHRLMK